MKPRRLGILGLAVCSEGSRQEDPICSLAQFQLLLEPFKTPNIPVLSVVTVVLQNHAEPIKWVLDGFGSSSGWMWLGLRGTQCTQVGIRNKY